MSYSLLSHLDFLKAELARGLAQDSNARFFALVDAMQRPDTAKPISKIVPNNACALLFEGLPQEAGAMALSPVLIELNPSAAEFEANIQSLDKGCKHRPILAILKANARLPDLATHLRDRIRIVASDNAYLIRIADSLMAAAFISVLRDTQRALFLGPIEAWWAQGIDGELMDLARGEKPPTDEVLPLNLDAEQTNALLDAAAIPVMAAQLSQFDKDFETQLSHFEQMRLVQQALSDAKLIGLEGDQELFDAILSAWAEHPTRPATGS